MVRCTWYNICNKICQWLATGQWFSLGTQVSSTNKTCCHDITEILLKVALNAINQIKPYQTEAVTLKNIWRKHIIKNGNLNCSDLIMSFFMLNILSFIICLFFFYFYHANVVSSTPHHEHLWYVCDVSKILLYCEHSLASIFDAILEYFNKVRKYVYLQDIPWYSKICVQCYHLFKGTLFKDGGKIKAKSDWLILCCLTSPATKDYIWNTL
jgi:hypothetical protein